MFLLVSDGQAYNGHSECLKVLLSYNASVDARSHGGVTALIAAAEGRNGDCTQILLQVILLELFNFYLTFYTSGVDTSV